MGTHSLDDFKVQVAFELVIGRYQRRLYRLAYRIVGNPSDAQDIVQNALLKAYQRLDQLRSAEKLEAWLYRITFNECRGWMRQRKRELTQLESDFAQGLLRAPPAPDEELIVAETRRRLHEAIASLPAKEREAVELFYLEELSYQTIQDRLGISKGLLSWRLNQARERLRQRFRESYQGFVGWALTHFPIRRNLSRFYCRPLLAQQGLMGSLQFISLSLLIHLLAWLSLPLPQLSAPGFLQQDSEMMSQEQSVQFMSLLETWQTQAHPDIRRKALLDHGTLTKALISLPPSLTSAPTRPVASVHPIRLPQIPMTPVVVSRPGSTFAHAVVPTSILNTHTTPRTPFILLLSAEPAPGAIRGRFSYSSQVGSALSRQPPQLSEQRHVFTATHPLYCIKGAEHTAVAALHFTGKDKLVIVRQWRDVPQWRAECWDIVSPASLYLLRDSELTRNPNLGDGNWERGGIVERAAIQPDLLANVSSGGGFRLAVATHAGILRRWDGVGHSKDLRPADGLTCLDFSPQGDLLTVQAGKALIDKGGRGDGATLLPVGEDIRLAIFSPSGAWLITAHLDGTVNVWNAQLDRVAHFITDGHAVEHLVCTPDETQILTCAKDGFVQRWHLASGKWIGSLRTQDATEYLAVSPDGRWLASSGRTTQIWDLANRPTENQQPTLRLPGLGPLSFSTDSHWLANVLHGKDIGVWEVTAVNQELQVTSYTEPQ